MAWTGMKRPLWSPCYKTSESPNYAHLPGYMRLDTDLTATLGSQRLQVTEECELTSPVVAQMSRIPRSLLLWRTSSRPRCPHKVSSSSGTWRKQSSLQFNASRSSMKSWMKKVSDYMLPRIPLTRRCALITVDMAYGTGLLAFNEVCKRVETMALQTEDEIRTEYIESKVTFHVPLFALLD